ncbi:MAG: sodium-dependent transporter [Candidatus Thermoplasmatota archaeon]
MEKWRSRAAFLLASIGSAVGLGNVWRFPYVCYKSGGGAFLIPYIIAIFVVGIPLLIAEFAIGSIYRKSSPMALKRISKKSEFAGWLSVIVAFFISIYYCVIVGWSLCYIFHSIFMAWGQDASSFFYYKFLSNVGQILFSILFVWVAIYLILYKGVESIGKFSLIAIPFPIILLLILTFVGFSLPNSIKGLEFYLSPDFSKLLLPSTWLSAFAQVFFSLSLAQGIMIAYGSYLEKKSDISNNSFITAFADSGIAFLGGFAVFSTLGYLSFATGMQFEEIAKGGFALAFITYPTVISKIPFLQAVFGIIFFSILFLFGLTSAYSMIEAISKSISEKFKISRGKSNFLICSIGFISGLIFIKNIFLIETADYFISDFALVACGLLECIIFAHLMGEEKLRKYINKVSEIKVGNWFGISLKFLAPAVLLLMLLASSTNLFNYPIAGFFIISLIFLISLILWRIKCQRAQ